MADETSEDTSTATADTTDVAAETTDTTADTAAETTVLTDDKDRQGAPESYADFNIPKEITMNDELLGSAAPVFKELGLSQIQAQQLIDIYSGHIQADSKAQADNFAQTLEGWVTEAKSDSEIGGNDFDENVGAAKRAIDKFGTPALVSMLNDTGLGSHPEVIRLFTRVSKLIVEDDPGGHAHQTAGERTAAEIMYPEMSGSGG